MTGLIWGAIALVAVLRSIAAFALPLTGDEAYYWEWSRRLAFGYVDHPPAVAWTIAAFSWLGHQPGFVRLGFVLCGVVASLALAAATIELTGNRRAGAIAALALTLTPLAVGGGVSSPEDVQRLLDAGADKPFPALEPLLGEWKEANPALGLRGARIHLLHEELLRQQIRALLRAALPGQALVQLVKLRARDLELVEATLGPNSPLVGRTVANAGLPSNSSLLLILRDGAGNWGPAARYPIVIDALSPIAGSPDPPPAHTGGPVVTVQLRDPGGSGIDLWRAFSAKARLQSSLDAAALAISSTNPAAFTTAQMQARAQAFFTANFPSGVVGKPGTVNLSFGQTQGSTKNNVIITSGSAQVPTTFMQLTGVPYLTLNAQAQVTLSAPNIDFYMLLDDSPSMLIGASSTDITNLISATRYECDSYVAGSPSSDSNCGCGFACHESAPDQDSCSEASAMQNNSSGGSLGPACDFV